MFIDLYQQVKVGQLVGGPWLGTRQVQLTSLFRLKA